MSAPLEIGSSNIAILYYRPGARLVEREICAMLRISRPPLREALRALEAEKLIHIIPHKGPVVASISLHEARDVYAMRALLESYATREFTLQADDAMVRALAAAVRQLRAEAKSGERKRLLSAKTRGRRSDPRELPRNGLHSLPVFR